MTREEYVRKAEEQIQNWRVQIDELSAKVAHAQADARDLYASEVAKLREHQHEAEARLDRLRQASEATWHDLRSEADAAWQRFGDTMRKSWDRFR